MTWVDYCIIVMALLSVLLGILRGFTREILSLLSWVSAFIAAAMFSARAGIYLEKFIVDPALREAAACALVFFATLVAGTIVTHIAVQFVRESLFSASDRTLGGGVGVIRAGLLLMVFVLIAGRYGAAEQHWWQQSAIVPKFVAPAQGLEALLPERWLKLLQPHPQTPPSPDS